jgi:hypothetical protein
MIETVSVTDHHPIPWTTKINPIWWLQGDDGWNVPEINNGVAYLPTVESMLLRRIIWFGFRNPLMNFVGHVIGVEDLNYTVTGTAPALATTGKDCVPIQEGWRYARINTRIPLPFVSYYKAGVVEFYLGWRPASGGFGLKIVKG